TVELKTEGLRNEIAAQMQARLGAMNRMAKRWQVEAVPDQEARVYDAGLMVKDFEGFRGVAWVDSSFHIRWIVPRESNGAAIGLNLAFEERRRAAPGYSPALARPTL